MSANVAGGIKIGRGLAVLQMLTVQDIAERLGVRENTIYNRIRLGELPASKVGRVHRIDPRDLESYLVRNRKQ